MRPIVAIIGSERDPHVTEMQAALDARGARTLVFDAPRWTRSTRLTLGSALADIEIDGERLPVPHAVYVRQTFSDLASYAQEHSDEVGRNWARALSAVRERSELLCALVLRWEALGAICYNSLRSAAHMRKPFQVALLHAAGIPVPLSAWTNDPRAVRSLAAEGQVVLKPVAGGASARVLSEVDESRLDTLRNAPATFQRCLPGKDMRVYVLDGAVAQAYAIDADQIDYRQNWEAIRAITLDSQVEKQCLLAARTLGLRFTGIDLKQDEGGVPHVLEANASPMFLGFDQAAQTSLKDRLADALFSAAR